MATNLETRQIDYERLQQVIDKDAIRETIQRQSAGINRLDHDMIRSCYTPDPKFTYLASRDDDGNIVSSDYTLPIYLERAGALLAETERAQYSVGSIMITLRGDEAYTESYVWSAKPTINYPDEPSQMRFSGVRYFDRFVRSGDEWLIAHRTIQTEWGCFVPLSDKRIGHFGPLPAGDAGVSRRDRSDPSYTLFGLVPGYDR